MKRSVLPFLLAPALVAGFFGAERLAGRGDASRVLRGEGESVLTLVPGRLTVHLPEGLPIHRDHDYELVTIYDNPTDHDIDAMAILYLYLLDKSFQESMASTAAPPASRTAAGS
jgi:hypothetical protein